MEENQAIMDAVDALPPLRVIIAEYNLRAEKSLGQNFLLDLNLTQKIAALNPAIKGQHIIEIGPGPGGLSRAILRENPASLTLLEKDHRAINALSSLVACAGAKTLLLETDALEADLTEFGQDGARHIIANLPYNIATPLLIGWLKQMHHSGERAFASMTLMFQKEVAQRITAQTGEKAYGRLGVIAQAICQTRLAMDIPPQAFTPPPKVVSSVVTFKPKTGDVLKKLPAFKTIEHVTALAFQQRRKMIRASLKAYLTEIERLDLDPTLRADHLTVQDYIALALEIEKRNA
jgi:16S rRNA (adenine1518-N6/adenine1519-N6)-dimethyltransferase